MPEPHESISGVIAELKAHLELEDPYRREPGRDPEGQNIYRLTLARLDRLDELTGPQYDDILAFARAECLERLGEWGGAAESFAIVVAGQTSLSELAGVREQWARRLDRLTAPPEVTNSLDAYRTHFESSRARLFDLLRADPPPSPPYGSYIRVERERALEQLALLLSANRFAPGSVELAVEAARTLAEENAESWRIGLHHLTLGRLFEASARDYTTLQPPEGARFDLGLWAGWIEGARDAYARAAALDGDAAKPEGQARLQALDAYAQSVRRRAR